MPAMRNTYSTPAKPSFEAVSTCEPTSGFVANPTPVAAWFASTSPSALLVSVEYRCAASDAPPPAHAPSPSHSAVPWDASVETPASSSSAIFSSFPERRPSPSRNPTCRTRR